MTDLCCNYLGSWNIWLYRQLLCLESFMNFSGSIVTIFVTKCWSVCAIGTIDSLPPCPSVSLSACQLHSVSVSFTPCLSVLLSACHCHSVSVSVTQCLSVSLSVCQCHSVPASVTQCMSASLFSVSQGYSVAARVNQSCHYRSEVFSVN